MVVSITGSVAGCSANGFDDWTSNHPASGNAGFAPPFQNESLWHGVPEPGARLHSRIMRFVLFMVFAWLLAGCGVTELRDRETALKRLLATNASLSTVEAVIGHIPVYKRGTEDWAQLHKGFAATNASTASRKIAAKMERSAATGFASTISMQTIIFLDDQGRLVDFVVDSQ